jgi:RimJ/RimL family protein N-acetyltransferase
MAAIEPRITTAKNGLKIVIRSARIEDAAALLEYIRTVAEDAPYLLMERDEFNFPVEQEEKWIKDHLDRPGSIVLIAEIGGQIVGVLNVENGMYRRVAHRGNFGISVAKQWRNRGIGSALLETMLQWASENPLIDKIEMEVFVINKNAIRLYKNFGFLEEGIRLKDVKLGPNEYVDTLAMYRFV